MQRRIVRRDRPPPESRLLAAENVPHHTALKLVATTLVLQLGFLTRRSRISPHILPIDMNQDLEHDDDEDNNDPSISHGLSPLLAFAFSKLTSWPGTGQLNADFLMLSRKTRL